jgi:hypothetical protein
MDGNSRKDAIPVAFISEVEADPGFNFPLLAIADALVRQGDADGFSIKPIFLLRDPIHAGHEAGKAGYIHLPAPTPLKPHDLISRGGSYASTLLDLGFAHGRDLRRAVNAWDSCFQLLSPRLIVACNSPIACLAARERFKTIVIGNGFTLPPVGQVAFPSPSAAYDTLINQRIFLDEINAIADTRRIGPLSSLPDLLMGEGQALLTLSILDPFRSLRAGHEHGPILGDAELGHAVSAPNMFLALPSTHPGLTACARAATRRGISITGFSFGPETVFSKSFSEHGGVMLKERPRLEKVLAENRFVASGDLDVIQAAIIAGKPIIILPGCFQKSRVAAELVAADIAINVSSYDVDHLESAFEAMMADSTRVQSALEFARRISRALPNQRTEQSVAKLCMELLRVR